MVEIKSKKEEDRILSAEKHGSDLLFYAMFFIAMTLLAFLFPPTVVDDLAWATETGWSRLENGFDGYNGRYLSNLLAIGLLRVPVLLPFVKGLTVTGMVFFIQRLSKSKSRVFLVLCAVYFAIPSPLFIQGYVWSSAFVNYYLSVLLTMINFYLLFYKTNLNRTENVLKCIYLFVFGIIGQLFMETISLLCVAVAVGAVVYFLRKTKKADAGSAVYAVACLAGSVIMFSNSAYSNILSKTDEYNRIVAVDEKNIFETLLSFLYKLFGEVSAWLFASAFPVIITVAVLCVILQKRKKPLRGGILFALSVLFVAGVLAAAAVALAVLSGKLETKAAQLCVGFLLLPLAVFCILSVWKLENKKRKMRLVVYFAMLLLQTVPFALVDPIGPRCFCAAYVLMILIAGELLGEVEIKEEAFRKLGVFALAAVLVFNGFCYSQMCISYNRKIDTVKAEVAKGNYEITLEHTSFGSLIYSADCEMKNKYLKKYFCDYYDLPYEIELTYK